MASTTTSSSSSFLSSKPLLSLLLARVLSSFLSMDPKDIEASLLSSSSSSSSSEEGEQEDANNNNSRRGGKVVFRQVQLLKRQIPLVSPSSSQSQPKPNKNSPPKPSPILSIDGSMEELSLVWNWSQSSILQDATLTIRKARMVVTMELVDIPPPPTTTTTHEDSSSSSSWWQTTQQLLVQRAQEWWGVVVVSPDDDSSTTTTTTTTTWKQTLIHNLLDTFALHLDDVHVEIQLLTSSSLQDNDNDDNHNNMAQFQFHVDSLVFAPMAETTTPQPTTTTTTTQHQPPPFRWLQLDIQNLSLWQQLPQPQLPQQHSTTTLNIIHLQNYTLLVRRVTGTRFLDWDHGYDIVGKKIEKNRSTGNDNEDNDPHEDDTTATLILYQNDTLTQCLLYLQETMAWHQPLTEHQEEEILWKEQEYATTRTTTPRQSDMRILLLLLLGSIGLIFLSILGVVRYGTNPLFLSLSTTVVDMWNGFFVGTAVLASVFIVVMRLGFVFGNSSQKKKKINLDTTTTMMTKVSASSSSHPATFRLPLRRIRIHLSDNHDDGNHDDESSSCIELTQCVLLGSLNGSHLYASVEDIHAHGTTKTTTTTTNPTQKKSSSNIMQVMVHGLRLTKQLDPNHTIPQWLINVDLISQCSIPGIFYLLEPLKCTVAKVRKDDGVLEIKFQSLTCIVQPDIPHDENENDEDDETNEGRRGGGGSKEFVKVMTKKIQTTGKKVTTTTGNKVTTTSHFFHEELLPHGMASLSKRNHQHEGRDGRSSSSRSSKEFVKVVTKQIQTTGKKMTKTTGKKVKETGHFFHDELLQHGMTSLPKRGTKKVTETGHVLQDELKHGLDHLKQHGKDIAKNLASTSSSAAASPSSGATESDEQAAQHRKQRLDTELYQELKKLKLLAQILEKIPLSKHRLGLRLYQKSFRGCDAVDYLLEHNLVHSRREAIKLCRDLQIEFNLFEHVLREFKFHDRQDCLYRFLDVKNRRQWDDELIPYNTSRRVEIDTTAVVPSLLPFPICLIIDDLLVVEGGPIPKDETNDAPLVFDRSRMVSLKGGEFYAVPGRVAPVLGLTFFLGEFQGRMVSLDHGRLHAVIDPVSPYEIHKFQFSADALRANPKYSAEDWFKTMGLSAPSTAPDNRQGARKKKQQQQQQQQDNDVQSSEKDNQKTSKKTAITLPYAYISRFRLQLSWKGLLIHTEESELNVKPFVGNEKTTLSDVISHFVYHVLGRTPGLLANAGLLGVNVVESTGMATAINMGAKFIPFGQYVGIAALAAYDGVTGALDAGKMARNDPNGSWKFGDIGRGLVYSAGAAAQTGAKHRGKTSHRSVPRPIGDHLLHPHDDGEEGYDESDHIPVDPLDFVIGTAAHTGSYVYENKARFAGATVAAATMVAMTVVTGPIGGVVVGVLAGRGAEVTVEKLERRFERKRKDKH